MRWAALALVGIAVVAVVYQEPAAYADRREQTGKDGGRVDQQSKVQPVSWIRATDQTKIERTGKWRELSATTTVG